MSAHVHTRTALVLAAAASLLAGCEKTPRDRLQGRWLGESHRKHLPRRGYEGFGLGEGHGDGVSVAAA